MDAAAGSYNGSSLLAGGACRVVCGAWSLCMSAAAGRYNGSSLLAGGGCGFVCSRTHWVNVDMRNVGPS